MKILVVDDDKEIVELLNIYLRNEGYTTEKAYNGTDAIEKFRRSPDIGLIILDIMMPDIDGIQVVQHLRKEGAHVPILMLTAKATDMNKIQGLIAGADDYVTKPFNALEVMARVKSLLRRTKMQSMPSTQGTLHAGPITIIKDSHEVKTQDGALINLTALEFGILHLLASNPNQVFSAEEIFERVWKQDNVVSAKTVMVHVSHLREKLEDATGEQIIKTVWGVGYKIEA